MKFVAYSDIHYSKLGARNITISDCEKVEAQVHARALEWAADFVLFCGDRFLKREPEDEVKVKADVAMIGFLEQYAQWRKNLTYFHLIGNHDWTANNKEWHTSRSLRLAQALQYNIVIMEEPKTYEVPRKDILLHALPAGFEFDFSKYDIDHNKFNLFVFHDQVVGAKYDDDGKAKAQSGISLPEIDRPEFQLVLAGDIHVPQKLAFKNTHGFYLGAVLQRTMADANRPRGWSEITVSQDNGRWKTMPEFCPTRNFFTRINFDVGTDTKYEDLSFDEQLLNDCLVEIRLTGTKKDVDRIASDPKWSNYEKYYPVRGFSLVRNYKAEKDEAVVDLSAGHNILEDLELYMDSGFVAVDDNEKSKILKKVSHLKG